MQNARPRGTVALMRGFRIFDHTEKVGGWEAAQRKEPQCRVGPRPEGHSP